MQTGETEHILTLEGDEEIRIKNDPAALRAGPLFVNGPMYSAIERLHYSIKAIDPLAEWPANSEHRWEQILLQNSQPYFFPAGAMNAYYVLQEIESALDQEIIMEVTAGESMIFFVNGKEQYFYYDMHKSDSTVHTVRVQLKK